jgi:hypothetical protein
MDRKRRSGRRLLALAGVALSILPYCTTTRERNGLAVGPGVGDSPVTVYITSCADAPIHLITFGENVGGSRTESGVPIYWQIASRSGSSQNRYQVGMQAPGFVTTVPLIGPLPPRPKPGELYSIEVNRFAMGMGFALSDLRTGYVYTSDYEYVDDDAYPRILSRACRTSPDATWTPRLLAGLTAALFVIVIARWKRRPARGSGRRVEAGIIAASIIVLTLAWLDAPRAPTLDYLPRGRPNPSRLVPTLRPDQRVLLIVDSNTVSRDAFATFEFRQSGPYVIHVGCDGTSIQVSEAMRIPDGVLGSRLVAMCDPTVALPGGLDDPPAGRVRLGVFAPGTAHWRVTVVTS